MKEREGSVCFSDRNRNTVLDQSYFYTAADRGYSHAPECRDGNGGAAGDDAGDGDDDGGGVGVVVVAMKGKRVVYRRKERGLRDTKACTHTHTHTYIHTHAYVRKVCTYTQIYTQWGREGLESYPAEL
jgi:hypothetical protein